MSKLSKNLSLSSLSIPKKLAFIVVVFCLMIGGLLSLSYFGMTVLSDVRAYVGGEGLWSKAQKDAVYYLTRYTILHDEKDFDAYSSYLKGPLGDRKARLEMENPSADFKKISEGFIEGRNHPQDVAGMANLFRRFHRIPFIRDAIVLWKQGDEYFSKLVHLGYEVHETVQAGQMTPARTQKFLSRIDRINNQLTPIEDQFSYVLGDGARWLNHCLLTSMLAVTGIFLVVGVAIAFFVSRRLVMEIYTLRTAAARIAKGDYNAPVEITSQDEIGDLAASFKEMAVHREEAETLLIKRADELDLANKKLIETEKLKGNFFAAVSHELRTPLTLIISPIESLLCGEHGVLFMQQREILEIMHNNGVRLLQMVTGLLDFSKLEAGRLEVNLQKTDIKSLTHSIFADFQPLMAIKKINGRFETNLSGLWIDMDRYLYERILFNLLSNAIKFTPNKGSIELKLHWSDEQLTVSVTDTGIGISQEDLPSLFQKFHQLESASTRRFEGSGLGLALVKEFTQLLNGSVKVKSELKKGSTFTVHCYAPLATGNEIENESPRHRTRMAQLYIPETIPSRSLNYMEGGPPKLLVAEDNGELVSYISTLLESSCDMRFAKNGEEAMTMVYQWKPDLILSDVMMPKLDGLELCRRIKADERTKSITVILLTALTHRDALLKGWEAGADDYLFKPFHPRELLMRIQSALKAVTERRRADHQIGQLNQDLEKKIEERTQTLRNLNDELRQFSFIASHDLREPVRKIRTLLDLLKQTIHENLDDQMLGMINRIQSSAHRMEQLIQSLSSFSEVNQDETVFQPVSLTDVINDVVADLEILLGQNQASIDLGPMPVVKGDPVQLRQLIQNLISNAVKFRSQDHPLKISIQSRSRGDGMIQIEVKDNGIGFDEHYAEMIFKPFERLHRRNNYEGTGMGLTICRKIVLRHKGEIYAFGKPNEGASFFFSLPLYSEANGKPQEQTTLGVV